MSEERTSNENKKTTNSCRRRCSSSSFFCSSIMKHLLILVLSALRFPSSEIVEKLERPRFSLLKKKKRGQCFFEYPY